NVDVQPTWSPDGKWIAFTSNRGNVDLQKGVRKGSSNWDIWMIGYDGQSLTRLTHNKARDGAPSIANNGKVYFHSDRKVSKQTRKMHRVSGSTGGFHIWSVSLPAKAG
ncbi:MAG: TolB family protein, partial [Mariprofundus sp.]